MQYNKSSNPALKTIEYVSLSSVKGAHMTAHGTYNKTFMLMVLLLVAGFFGWNTPTVIPITLLLIVTFGIGLGIAIFLAFKPLYAKYLAPIYALLQGYFLGVISLFFESAYPGIAFQAILLTVIIAFAMNFLYRFEVIKVTQKFRSIVILAMFGVFGVYLISFIMSFFGTTIPLIHESGPIGIIFSLVVITIAALMLIVDYDLIDRLAKKGAPQAMEWYGAFAITVTLIWLYIELLNLLRKLRDNF